MQITCIEQELAFDLLNSEFGMGNSKHKWTMIGEGTYRTAFLGEDGKVYKIPNGTYDEYVGENECEYRNYLRMKQLPDFNWEGNLWKLPAEMQLFKFPSFGEYVGPDRMYNLSVIVSTFVPGEPFDKCLDNCGAEELHYCIEYDRANLYYAMFDLGHENVRVQPDGTRIMIDLQC